MHPHPRIDNAPLVALLQQWTAQAAAPGAARPDIAEQLGQGLGTVDAVALRRALHTIEAGGQDAGAPVAHVDAAALENMVQEARAELAQRACAPPEPPRPARQRPDHTAAPPPDAAQKADFAHHAPRYLGLQKHMDARLRSLRAQVRQALGHGEPSLRRLAALDAVMERMLAEREQRLWASLAAHLDRRFVHLRQAHAQRAATQGAIGDDDPQAWQRPGGWLHAFEQDLQALVLAEMQLRLLPLLGLVEAARNENRKPQE